MSQQSDNLNLSNLIAEAIDAEAAGVFSPTGVEVSSLMGRQVGGSADRFSPKHALFARFVEKAMVGLPLAACLGIVVGIASMSHRMSHDGGSLVMLDSNGSSAMPACDMKVFARCLTGPGQTVSGQTVSGQTVSGQTVSGQAVPADCGCVDLDDDGDVDLSDMSSYQQLARLSP